MINFIELLHNIHDLPHNAFYIFSGPLSTLTLLPHILQNLLVLLINYEEFLHTLHDLPHNVFDLFSGPSSILTLLPRILPTH
jgi:hypothetical protein